VSALAISPNFPKDLSPKQKLAAPLVAADELTDEQIAAEIGITKRTLTNWKQDDAFMAVVDEHIQRFERDIFRTAFARKSKRVRALNAVAGAVLVQMGQAQYQHIISVTDDGEHVYGFDKDRLREFREYLTDIAEEMGERQAKNNSAANGVVVKVYTDIRLGGPSALEAEWHDAPPPRSSADR
jgi:hypothetical protein